jgi:chorismate mutase/prephenate dehydratase
MLPLENSAAGSVNAVYDLMMRYNFNIVRSVRLQSEEGFTRYICIARDLEIYPGADRTRLMLVLPHKPGSLYKVLSRFYALGINIIKLESRPIPNRDFEFMFYFDIECPAASPQFLTLMDSLSEACEEFRYLGSYTEVV